MNPAASKPRASKRAPRKGKKAIDPAVDPQLSLALAKHMRSQQAVLTQLASRSAKGGAFSNLGGDVDSMITHGQEAWSMVKRMLNVESKAIENYENSAVGNVSTTPLFTDLTALITQGDADYQRDGDSLKINRISMAYTIFGSADFLRVLVTESVDEAITAADLLARIGDTYAVTSPLAWDTRQQFHVLYDRAHAANSNITGVLDHQVHRFETKKQIHVQYLNGTATVEKGAIQVWFVTRSAGVGHELSTQLEYVDN
jgi:hypothetical protein